MYICLILLFIGLLLYYYSTWQETRHQKEFETFISDSNGTYDESAKLAQETYEMIQNPTPKETFLNARIVHLNQYEGNIDNVEALDDVIQNYQQVLDDTELDWFELEQIEMFANRHQDFLAGANNQNYNNFIDTVFETRPKKIKTTIEEAIEESKNKKEAYEKFVENNKTHTSDTQNVHDSEVNHQLSRSFNALKQATLPISDNLDMIKDDVLNYAKSLPNESQDRIRKSIDRIVSGKSYNSSIKTTEDELLKLVWSRCYDKTNSTNERLIKDAVIESLLDMTNNGSTVCSTGRCSRLIDSLTLLDSNKELASGFATSEQLRNDSLDKSNEILENCIKVYSESNDSRLKEVALSYQDPKIVTNDESEKLFKDIVKCEINNYLSTTIKDKMTDVDYEKIKDHCLSAIDY